MDSLKSVHSVILRSQNQAILTKSSNKAMFYKLVCLSLDGEKVTEGEFSTVRDAQHRSEFMGSRWHFYPIRVVTGKIKILELPDEIEFGDDTIDLGQFKGKNITTLIKFLKNSYKEIYGLNTLEETMILTC